MRFQLIGAKPVLAALLLAIAVCGTAAASAVLGGKQPAITVCASVRCVASEASDGVAFVSEEADPNDGWLASGKFSAHWESEDGSTTLEGPVGVPIEQALRWARKQTRSVVLLINDEAYSAGKEVDPSLPQWTEDGSTIGTRPAGTSLGQGDGDVAWVLESTIAFGGDAQTVAALKAGLDAVAIEDIVIRGGRCMITYRIQAAGSVEAVLDGERLLDQAADDARKRIGKGVEVIGTEILGPAAQRR